MADEKKVQRQQLSKLAGIDLSVSRVRRSIDKDLINAGVEAACAELRALMQDDKAVMSDATKALVDTAYATVYDARKAKHDALVEKLKTTKGGAKKIKELKAPERKDTLEEKLEFVSKLRRRFSNDASVALSAALDYVVQDLVRAAMVNAHSCKKAIIQVGHVAHENFKGVNVMPLVGVLDVVQEAAVPAAEDAEDAAGDDGGNEEGASFAFYVNLVCKRVKAKLVEEDEAYNSIRISKGIRTFCSTVVLQLIARLAPLVELYVDSAKVKTVNVAVVMFVLRFILADAKHDLSGLFEFVDARLAQFQSAK